VNELRQAGHARRGRDAARASRLGEISKEFVLRSA
jgi:hypothetical protein